MLWCVDAFRSAVPGWTGRTVASPEVLQHSLSSGSLLPSLGPPGKWNSGDHSMTCPMVAHARDYLNNFSGGTILSPRLPLVPRRHSTRATGMVMANPAGPLCRYVPLSLKYRTQRGQYPPLRDLLVFQAAQNWSSGRETQKSLSPTPHIPPSRLQCCTWRGNILPSVTSSAPKRTRTRVVGETLKSLAGPLHISAVELPIPHTEGQRPPLCELFSFPIAISPSFEKEGRT